MGNPLGFKQYLLAWLILGGITLLQAMSGTRFIYSACSNLMKRHYGISQMQVNNLIVASESGKVFGCFPTAAKKYLPEWMILVIGLMFGSVGYGALYLSISTNHPSLSYWQILFFNVLAGNSICWINTYCDLLAAKNFKHTQDTVTELASSYSGLTGKIYTSLVEGIQGRKLVSEDSSKIYLLLSCLAPATVGLPVALLNCVINVGEYEEAKLFPFVFVIVIATGVYAFIENTAQPFTQMSLKLRVVNFMLVAMLPLVVALLMAARYIITLAKYDTQDTNERVKITVENHETVVTEKLAVGNENNGLKKLVKSVDFWLFYMMNMCGVTLGMVYLNNLEIISESQGYHKPLFLLATSSTFVFFGRGNINNLETSIDDADNDFNAFGILLAHHQQQDVSIHQHMHYCNWSWSHNRHRLILNIRVLEHQLQFSY
ncbi:protein NUCLEAR FUSION DEFECTIVE 4-like [Pistacia vera]|uniref:protein NUCLEAR FUSION DEFECTIVE 4-like n=1 Tax=Pistacia vera TaxID=55513 RepID=UPI001262C07A|nr:protein NUCLEAR FUSION DEFECTIVE 4-like [Pistacia vera]